VVFKLDNKKQPISARKQKKQSLHPLQRSASLEDVLLLASRI
jgi:hypothetical protein